jgi:HK97 family phage prohead protease
MGDSEAVSDFPDADQRYAFCNSQWDNKEHKPMDKKDFKSFSIQIKDKDSDKREVVAIGSKQGVDRDGDILHLDGLQLTNYRKNPVVLWSHKSSDLPIGKSKKVWVDGKDLKFNIQFAGPEENPFADSVYKMVKGGFINSLSVGFSPDWEKSKFNDKRGGYDFYKSELLEVSVVNVPANQGARVIQRSLDEAVEAGVIDELERKDFELTLKDEDVYEVDGEEVTKEEWFEKVDEIEDEITNDIIKSEEPNKEEMLLERIERLEKEIAQLKQESTPVEETGDIHIVDQFLSEYFESSDFQSADDSTKDSDKDDDLNSLIDEVLE